jgi:DeoR family transcriptional regulator, fructose operon transcriptional repressor
MGSDNPSIGNKSSNDKDSFIGNTRMQAEERQKRITDHLLQVEFASLDELSELVDASISTVRRDLTLLETRGQLKRTHGGARLIQPKSEEFIFTERDTHEADEKDRIGKACAAHIPAHQSVIIDAGTTAYHVAKHLESKSPQIITNSLPVANLYASNGMVEVILSGGVIYPRLGVLVGPLAIESFSRMHADIAIMGSGGITEEGITNSHNLLIDIQKEMIRAARRVIFCLDHTKFGRKSISFLCELNKVDAILTDTRAPQAMLDRLRMEGIEIIQTA